MDPSFSKRGWGDLQIVFNISPNQKTPKNPKKKPTLPQSLPMKGGM